MVEAITRDISADNKPDGLSYNKAYCQRHGLNSKVSVVIHIGEPSAEGLVVGNALKNGSLVQSETRRQWNAKFDIAVVWASNEQK